MYKIITKPNPIGIPITENEIDSVLSPTTEHEKFLNEWILCFFKIPKEYLHKGLLERYVKASSVTKNISMGSYQYRIYTKLISTMCSAKRCFSYNENLACIELCALLAEMLTSYLCIANFNIINTPSIKSILQNTNKELYKKIKKYKDFKILEQIISAGKSSLFRNRSSTNS